MDVSLSDRLNKAKNQRLIAAGVLPGDQALEPEESAEPAVDEADTFAPITIEVRPTGLHPVAESHDLGEIATATCPTCNRPAHLDLVDLVGHTHHYSCATCGAMWQTREPSSENITR